MKKIYIINGKNIVDLKSLFSEFARVVNAPGGYFGKCLQSFDDCLFGGFGLEAPCEIIWINSDFSRDYLNDKMLEEYYEDILRKNKILTEEGKKYVIETIDSAKKGKKSMFDEVIRLIESVTERAELIDNWTIDLVLK
ncbi:barstar family protein [Clostridium beijerinckii]|uniref:RNAse (Barnase) inhibitor barstar n=2 Tax=Clostridium beijerinckii TaxID=1520 RepID=A0A9Q5CNV0_CLOBE|nr:barstar family protein [Clostridium beijerinckii]AQS06650.1 barstar (barnase inhibitor) [Clostridium beijerinckii]MBA2887784.1 RNAse (barnase) inhibitor barstar [Clostridium beijerinckii]MBA9013727.1 RNAse (barnase) inhibitor barstar [Clostridium beijerinckii]MBC2417316.1 hypothetical protein [Clostridium beijerinckii]MBC2422520.1 hypothetical protein [Clostridium beijerinckii]